MKNTYLLFTLLCCSILFLSNTSEEGFLPSFLIIDDEKVPDLPKRPFDYRNVKLPNHLVSTPYGSTNTIASFGLITDDGATLGRVLFYDELLSANENLSCATCHQQHLSFADANPFSEGVSEDTKRNSMQLNDLGWSNDMAFFWDLSQGNMEEMIALPLQNENEIGVTDFETLVEKLNASSYYPELFENAFDSPEITMEKIQSSIGQFIRSMVTFESRFDQVMRGDEGMEFTTRENLGHELFLVHCEECHVSGQRFSTENTTYPTNVLLNKPLFSNEMGIDPNDPGAGGWYNAIEGLFKSPTLRNIAVTAPYMHDGRFETLREVIDHYSEGVIDDPQWGMLPAGGLRFTSLEKHSLEAFLETFTDESFLTEVKWSDPFIERQNDPEDTTYTTGTQEVLIANTTVFPNPSNGMTFVTFDNIGGKNVRAYLLNIQGQLIRKMSTHNNGFATDVSQLSSGVYIIRILTGESFIDKQLIVQ